MVPPFFLLILGRFLLLLLAYSASRLLFLYWNLNLFADVSRLDIVLAFIHGLRFDTSAILLTNAPLVLIWMIPWSVCRRVWFCRIELFLFTLINFIAIGMNFVDAEFVKFIGKRSSYDLLMIGGDVQRQSLSVLWTYRGFLIGLTLLIALIVWKAPRFPSQAVKNGWFQFVFWRLLVVACMALGIRGGWQLKPLHPMHAYFTTNHSVGLLTLNTPFNFLRSRPRMTIERTRYFSDDSSAIQIARDNTTLTRQPLGLAQRWNVVILILESFATEYMGVANDGHGYTPFLDELAKKSYYFRYNFANSRRSIEGLPAVLCGLPGIMLEPVITSDFASNRLDCLPKILAGHEYSTYFLHGAHNGSMHFDTFSKIAGFEKFVGLDEFPKDNPEDFDKHWGVLDEPMLQYAVRVMDEAPKPSLVSVFTLSSHHPYYVPRRYAGRFPKGTLEIHETIGYTDYSVSRFFAEAKSRDWFNSTIFIITADHTQKSDQVRYGDLLGGYRVPLLIYIPGLDQKLSYSPDRITQHADIVPTVLDLLGITKEDRLLTGQSVFDVGRDGFVYNYTTASYWYLDSKVFFDMGRPPNGNAAKRHANTFSLKVIPEDDPDVEIGRQRLKGIVHYLNNGLIKNSLHGWRRAIE